MNKGVLSQKEKELLGQNLEKRNIQCIFCAHKEEAVHTILEIIPATAKVGISGSLTLNEIGILSRLEERGTYVFNQYKPGIDRQESLSIRNRGAQADYFLTSANAISLTGELVFFSAYGNRTAGIANASNVLVVCGTNKITPGLVQAIRRSREYVTPRNCQRLDWHTPCRSDGRCRQEICLFPEYKRMCAQVLIMEAEVVSGRVRVIVIQEELGF